MMPNRETDPKPDRKPKLTQTAIKDFQYQGVRYPPKERGGKKRLGRDVRWDSEMHGFGVRVFPTGRKVFVLSFRDPHGSKRLMALGDFGVLTLQQAREMARESLVAVTKGDDPLARRKSATQGDNMEELCKQYINRHAKLHKKTWKEDKRRIDRNILPRWKARKIITIARTDVAALHRQIGANAPYEANRTLELLHKIFKVAVTLGFLPDDAKNPAAGIDRFRETKRERWVKEDELRKLIDAIRAEENRYLEAAIWLFLLTGVRRNELLRAKWDQVDFNLKELYLPDTKSGRSHTVPLSAPAVQILSNMPKEEGNPYIVPGANEGDHFKNIDRAWDRIRTRAGLPDVRLHDLRRTVGSWLAMDGASLLVIGKTLGHTTPSTTMVYSRLSQDPVRGALERHGAKIMAVANNKPPAKITALEKDA
jgi:integrase